MKHGELSPIPYASGKEVDLFGLGAEAEAGACTAGWIRDKGEGTGVRNRDADEGGLVRLDSRGVLT